MKTIEETQNNQIRIYYSYWPFWRKKVRSTHTKTAQYYKNDTKNKTLPVVRYPTKFVLFQERKPFLYSAIELRSVGYKTKSNNDDEVNMRYDIKIIIWA